MKTKNTLPHLLVILTLFFWFTSCKQQDSFFLSADQAQGAKADLLSDLSANPAASNLEEQLISDNNSTQQIALSEEEGEQSMKANSRPSEAIEVASATATAVATSTNGEDELPTSSANTILAAQSAVQGQSNVAADSTPVASEKAAMDPRCIEADKITLQNYDDVKCEDGKILVCHFAGCKTKTAHVINVAKQAFFGPDHNDDKNGGLNQHGNYVLDCNQVNYDKKLNYDSEENQIPCLCAQ